MEDNGILTFHCENHFKPVLFCTCKERYDDSQAMIFCDECCEWYHDKCVGLNPKDASRLDRYVCTTCKSTISDGKSVSKTLKDKNLAKEYQSACHQTAIKSVGLLVELAGSVCPLIDDINLSSRKSEYSVREVREAKEYLSAPPFDLSALSAEDQAENPLETLGAQQLVNSWKEKIVQYLDRYDEWLGDVKRVFGEMSSQITLSLGPDQLQVVQTVLGELARLETAVTSTGQSIPLDVEAFFAFHECVKWMGDFLQVRPIYSSVCVPMCLFRADAADGHVFPLDISLDRYMSAAAVQ